MASIIRIKRSSVSGNPSTLGAGELAYSNLADNGSNGGDRLYIGMGSETSGNAANHVVIGGKYFTDKLDHTPGILTASSALIADSDSKLDNLKVDNLDLNGNTISSTNTNGNIILDPNGTGQVEVVGDLTVTGTINATITGSSDTANKWTTPRDLSLTGDATATLSDVDGSDDVSAVLTLATVNTDVGTYGSATSIPVLTVNAKGLVTGVSTASISTALSVAADTGTTDSVSLGTDTLTFTGGEGIDTQVSNNTITISAEIATDTNLGVASFGSSDFALSSGAVSLKTVNTNVGSFGSSTEVPIITVDGKGRITSASTASISGAITLDGDVSASGTTGTTTTVTLATVNTNVGTFGSSSAVPVVTVNAKGLVTAVSTQNISTSFTLAGDTGSDTFNNGGTLTFTGTNPVQTVVTDNVVTISVDDATTTSKGIAQFSSGNFATSSGTVTIKDAGVSNSKLENSSLTIGSTSISLGDTSLSISGLQQLDVDNITIDGNEISSTNTNGNISLKPNGTGTIDVNNSKITSVATPTQSTDAVNKAYVDSIAEGLSVKPAVRVATTTEITATYDNGTLGVGSTLTIPATATLNIDGVTSWSLYDGILVKDQTNAFENGRYYVSTIGNISTAWVLTRCAKCDEPSEIPSMYVFVQEGTVNASTGWTAYVEDFADFDVGVDDINFAQFSGAGTYLAGDALSITGSTFNVNVATDGGIEISADALQLKSSIAGNGLSYVDGVITVGGTTDRITIDADTIDIDANYVGQSSITTVGTISSGTWEGTLVSPTYGGTGINNGSNTISLGGSITTAGEITFNGANKLSFTTTGETSVTLPTTGTLATLDGAETLTNKTLTSPAIAGGSIDNTPIGALTASSGAFTTIDASGLISFTNTTDASPSPTSAAVVMDGGLSVAKSIIVGTNITGSGAGTSTLDGFNIDGGTY